MRLIGPIRLRTVHTKKKACRIDTGVNDCYYNNLDDNDGSIVRDDIDGVKFRTCE